MKLDDLKATVKNEFEHEGFLFKKDSKYFVEQDGYYIYLIDNNNKEHILTYDEADKLLYSV